VNTLAILVVVFLAVCWGNSDWEQDIVMALETWEEDQPEEHTWIEVTGSQGWS